LIKFKNVSKKYSNNIKAVDNISFEIEKGECLVLLGTSGSGKTTTMRMINKLTCPTSGEIFVNDKNILDLDPITLRRQIGYAIQSIGLFNHMSVFENISIVLKLLKWDKKRIKKRVFELLEMFGFEPEEFSLRYPLELSGGQKQRIGVLRALAADASIILMDEPFGYLDPITREQVQNEFIELTAGINKTIVFVTHDIFEATKMANRIALMDEGKIVQIATPKELVQTPKNEVVKKFLKRHELQLSLMTTSLKDFIKPQKTSVNSSNQENSLSIRSSVIDALDLFKESKKSFLNVFDKNNFIGQIRKKDLVNSISELFKENER
jgi:osmoprotectant transport system ATP-binding protein